MTLVVSESVPSWLSWRSKIRDCWGQSVCADVSKPPAAGAHCTA